MTENRDDPLVFGAEDGKRELWLFTLFVPSDDAARWEPPRPGYPERDWPLEETLGAGPLDPAHVFVFEASDLGTEGLRRYLIGAHGMDPQMVNADAGKLDAIRGTVVLVLSGALKQRPGKMTPRPPLNFIGRYAEAESLEPAAPHPVRPSTKGHLPGPAGAPEDRGRLGLWALVTLGALGGIALLVWWLA